MDRTPQIIQPLYFLCLNHTMSFDPFGKEGDIPSELGIHSNLFSQLFFLIWVSSFTNYCKKMFLCARLREVQNYGLMTYLAVCF